MSIRRGLTIPEENDIGIQHKRSEYLLKNPPQDVDYTDMVNRLIKIGLEKKYQNQKT